MLEPLFLLSVPAIPTPLLFFVVLPVLLKALLFLPSFAAPQFQVSRLLTL